MSVYTTYFRVWACDERNPQQQQQQHTVPRAAAAPEVATVDVRPVTPKPDLGQLRRLPRQAMHLAGASPQTMKNYLRF